MPVPSLRMMQFSNKKISMSQDRPLLLMYFFVIISLREILDFQDFLYTCIQRKTYFIEIFISNEILILTGKQLTCQLRHTKPKVVIHIYQILVNTHLQTVKIREKTLKKLSDTVSQLLIQKLQYKSQNCRNKKPKTSLIYKLFAMCIRKTSDVFVFTQ